MIKKESVSEEERTLPPHCDSLDGPVVTAARRALEAADVDLVLAFVPAAAEAEVREAFDTVMPVRSLGAAARDVADRHFFETVVRLHRAGEGAPYTGLRPAGQPVGPVIPVAERAVESGSPAEVLDVLTGALRDEVTSRLAEVTRLAGARGRSVADARRYTEAMLGFEVYSHHLYEAIRARHGHGHGH